MSGYEDRSGGYRGRGRGRGGYGDQGDRGGGYGDRPGYDRPSSGRGGYDRGGGGYERREGSDRGGYGGRGRGRGRGYRQGPRPPVDNPNFKPNWNHTVDDFDSMGLRDELLHGIYSYGFKHPSEIQSLAIAPIKEGRSVIAQAQSGTGKTGAFTVGILERVNLSEATTQALVLSPTRELADQTYEFFVSIGNRLPGLNVAIFTGGRSVEESQRKAAEGPHIAVATPGRALSLINDGYLRCENMTLVCLDEADELLSTGFLDQIYEIFQFFSEHIQFLLFSATIPGEAFSIMERFTRDPVKILVTAEKLTLEGIRQFFVNVDRPDLKFGTLTDIYGNLSIQKAIIFANTKQTVDSLQQGFEASSFPVSAIHSGLEQRDRSEIMRRFRMGNTRVLVATDLLARGIDVQQITLVINYELPSSDEQYLHRIGRSGRYGRKGVAINLCDRDDMERIQQIEAYYQTRIEELPQDFAEIVQAANESAEPSASK
jgi:translation initiation factor 4A